ncbi:MAG: ribonuclease P protein component [Acidobacteria bacterium]|nr:ribonuclease P protein component [Acidobacteriota bacterium]
MTSEPSRGHRAAPPAPTGLPRAERVRRRPEFLANYERGSRSSSRLMTVFVLANGGPAARLGIAATRKLGNAVQRNRAKRLVREAFRRHKPLAGLDVIVIPKREMLVADYRAVEADYCAILLRRRLKIREA